MLHVDWVASIGRMNLHCTVNVFFNVDFLPRRRWGNENECDDVLSGEETNESTLTLDPLTVLARVVLE